MTHTFVALDLETTGLSPEKDTIIEVAAIRYEIEERDGIFQVKNIEERTMLISPGRPISEEVSMITGITDDMLVDKPLWTDVRERVSEFIGESIIVGHNVLFDIAMLRTHGLDLSTRTVIDTFELSEIFSQEAESLNLGFLAGLYGLSAGDKEHRALGDTRLSVGLFFHYLNGLKSITDRKKSILTLAGQREAHPSIRLLTTLTDINTETSYSLPIDSSTHRVQEWTRHTHIPHTWIHITSLSPGYSEEQDYIRRTLQEQKPQTVAVFGARQAEYMESLLTDLGQSYQLLHTHGEYISIDELAYRMTKPSWSRKETILITKLLWWLEDTQTGLLSELKLYGEERSEITFFRMRDGEESPFYTPDKQDSLLIEDLGRTLHESSRWRQTGPIIIKDIPLIEDALRRAMSIHIDIERLIHTLESLTETRRLIGAIRWIEGIYLGLPDRPTGPSAIPPGEYGETYFLTQEDVWHRGGEHLAITTRVLIESYHDWCRVRTLNDRHDEILTELVDRAIGAMIAYHTVQEETGVIIEIQSDTVRLSYIPRKTDRALQTFLQGHSCVHAYGVRIDGEKVARFLLEEGGLSEAIVSFWSETTPSLQVNEESIKKLQKEGSLGGTVILTTSAKQVREIGKSLANTGLKILMQWVSGGKGKQLGLFLRNPDTTVVIGTIDMWREELSLWRAARHIVIAKLPFDPPTDPYFLARTVGMTNNFARYSEPMTIIKMNILIARIRSAGFVWPIYCQDMRLHETIWWQQLMREMV